MNPVDQKGPYSSKGLKVQYFKSMRKSYHSKAQTQKECLLKFRDTVPYTREDGRIQPFNITKYDNVYLKKKRATLTVKERCFMYKREIDRHELVKDILLKRGRDASHLDKVIKKLYLQINSIIC